MAYRPIFLGVCLMWGASTLAQDALAQDRVVLRRKGVGGSIVVNGSIEDFTGAEIRMRSMTDNLVRSYPASEVAEFDTTHTEPHDRGLDLAGRRDWGAATTEFEAALKQETRGWVRREILAQLVRLALRRGDYSQAGARFIALMKSDPTSQHFTLIPLAWGAFKLSPELHADARAWLSSDDEPACLLGASLLFDDVQDRAQAQTRLRRLAIGGDERVRQLARLQTLRRDVGGGSANDTSLDQLQTRIDELPVDLRAGPMYLLGHAWADRHEYELAAAALLWLPLVDDHDARLAAQAGVEAGEALIQIGQRAQADNLFREIVRRFADTPAADAARRLLHASAEIERRQLKGITP